MSRLVGIQPLPRVGKARLGGPLRGANAAGGWRQGSGCELSRSRLVVPRAEDQADGEEESDDGDEAVGDGGDPVRGAVSRPEGGVCDLECEERGEEAWA